MRRLAVTAALMLGALPAFAHVTPNVELVKKGEFIRQSLPGTTKFMEQHLNLSAPEVAGVKKATGWTPSSEEVHVYAGRDDQGALLGRVVLVWIVSEHGPMGVAVAFEPGGKIRRVAVTDIGSEPLAWVRPLVDNDGLAMLIGLPVDAAPDPARIRPEVAGAMSRYFAKVLVQGVVRAQALERLLLP